ncbi:ATP-dependent DNA ligase [Ideonella sp. A 288]|uniref:ATP-dependent DNA ligase n=1 Tax=Ideonella sp. A 288 TaxID=1962181 RepID=UPI000B4A8E4A|nr:ATP-dependent DNA ligase [Ideonella sp. A 288]
MQRFACLYAELDATTSTEAKVDALVRYLAQAPAADAAWAVYFLAGGRPRRTVPMAVLRAQAQAQAGLPDWLFEASYQAVGDLAETIAQLLPPPEEAPPLGLHAWMHDRLLPLRTLPAEAQAAQVARWLHILSVDGRFLLVKFIGGGFRVGVSRLLVQRALGRHAGLDAKLVAQRMMGWTDAREPPTADRLAALLAPASTLQAASGQPYPFFLAHPLVAPDASLGPASDWMAEWKYDGIRAQVVRRAGQVWIWSRGEELVTERFPEVVAQVGALPDGTVLDGELLAWAADGPAPFQLLQQRIQRKQLTPRVLAAAPVRFVAYDLLEDGGADLRALPQHERRRRLEARLAEGPVAVSPLLAGGDWPALAALREDSRVRRVEGLMLKHRESAYGTGRTRSDGVWWKWKIDPMAVDAVLIYAQAGHGRRSGVYTDYTFAVWNRPPLDAAEAQAVVEAIGRREPAQPGALQLVAFAKAYSGLTDAEFRDVDARIRATTLEKFGPVRSVRPTLVFTLGFEGIQASRRHKSGLAVRFPRMLRVRTDKPLHEADALPTLLELLEPSTR